MENATTFFGLPIINQEFVKESDIAQLPFYTFWQESARGSTMLVQDNETLVYLYDWEAFSRLFIATGKHRYQS